MIYIFDSYYNDKETITACIGIENWQSENPGLQFSEKSLVESEYISGQFYKRELPGIINLLKKINLKKSDLIIIDGYVYLDDYQSNGLGGYLYEELNKEIPIIGVAKKKYKLLQNGCREVYRGKSKKPLFVTTAGIDVDRAKKIIEEMPGSFRIPLILKLVDQLSKVHRVN